jgi:outer membrane protein assembly factor BamA
LDIRFYQALNFLFRSGFTVPLAGDKLRISDKYFLGGPTSLRGFRVSGIGAFSRSKLSKLNVIIYAKLLSFFKMMHWEETCFIHYPLT